MSFYIENYSVNNLERLNFRYNYVFSDNEVKVYTYRFPVYRYNATMVLEGEFRVYTDDGTVIIDVFDCGTRSRYAPFYYYEYGDYTPILTKIWNQINKEMTKLQIKEKEDDETNQGEVLREFRWSEGKPVRKDKKGFMDRPKKCRKRSNEEG